MDPGIIQAIFTARDITHQATTGGPPATSIIGTPIGIAGTGGIADGTIVEVLKAQVSRLGRRDRQSQCPRRLRR